MMHEMTMNRIAFSGTRMMTMRRVLAALITAVMLAACSHKSLKAPCDLNEGKQTAMNGSSIAALLPDTFSALIPVADPCGPLRRIGQD